MDFIRVAYKDNKDGTREFYPSLQALESQDLVIRGGQFVAIWDEETGLYSRRQSHVPDIIDRAFAKMVGERLRPGDTVKKMRVFDNQLYTKFLALIRSIGDMGPELDQTIVFADQTPTKADAATFKMPYSLSTKPHPAWDKILNTLYDPEQRIKIEYAIGSIFTGASAKNMQKFYVFFGPPGTGKSTIMDIIELLFEGHTATFSAFEMGKADAQFSLEPFARNPLVAIDQDGDLSRLELNKNLNSVVSHDRVLINSKGKNLYAITPRACLFIGSNEPVKISNRKSGLFRRLVDIQPTGNLIPEDEYHNLTAQVKFELGAIATRCIDVFNMMGPTYLSSYRSTDMMYRTNDIFNFVQDNRLILEKNVTLKQAHKMYADWCVETDTRNVYKQYQFRDLLMDYFKEFHSEIMVDGVRHRSYFMHLRELEKFSWKGEAPKPTRTWLELESQPSLLDEVLKDEKAQLYSGNPDHPLKKPWEQVVDTLKTIDTSEEHYVKVPKQHIVIDFDLKNALGEKDLEANLKAAAAWPPTYVEVSKSGKGLHLHYDYEGDVEKLAGADPKGQFEVKTLLGNSSLRRRVSLCNNIPVASIDSGLPLKEEKVLSQKTMSSEKGLRELIVRALKKEIHGYGTKIHMDFIMKVLTDAQNQGMVYDVSDMWDDILQFAMSASNQSSKCIEIALALPLKSEIEVEAESPEDDNAPIVYFDLEVYPNLFAVGYMYDRDDAEVVKLINPTPEQCEELFRLKLIGWNNRGYDAHILWARTLGYDNQALYDLSQRIIVEHDRRAGFLPAYKACYADAYEYASTPNKKSLKKWEIDLGLPHMEMDLPWDQPVPEDRIMDVMEYLENDVRSTRAVCKHIEADFFARQILADLSGLEVINTTRQHAEKIIFGDVPWDTQPDLVYTDLSEMFPGYTFDQFASGKEKSTYKGEKVGEGGLVRSKPGMYENVALLDVASMHPTSIIELNLFGEYTPKFKALMDARLAIKRKDLEAAGQMFDGKLKPYLAEEHLKNLSDALKIVINSIYGFTAATFPNKFKDPRNIDNIVAKRGALFMLDLREYVESLGFEIIHIKTDSVKIPNATPEIIEKVMEFGKKYGYDFEHEATYERFCLVNDAVYVCRKDGKWSATGAQFQHPIVFKTLFSKEDITTKDYVEVKQVAKGAMYLETVETGIRQFVGRFGAFIPVIGGRYLVRVDGDKEGAVTGTKDWLWEIDELAIGEDMEIDMSYYQKLVNDAVINISKYGDFEAFIAP
jgi:hypothetical protein